MPGSANWFGGPGWTRLPSLAAGLVAIAEKGSTAGVGVGVGGGGLQARAAPQLVGQGAFTRAGQGKGSRGALAHK
jgi:hypothetical protein